MKIFPDYFRPYSIDSIYEPINVRHFWVYNAVQRDFFLRPITHLDEVESEAFKIKIGQGEPFWVPLDWMILSTENDTYSLDVVPIKNCSSTQHFAVLFNPQLFRLETAPIEVLEYSAKQFLCHPLVEKYEYLVHPSTREIRRTKKYTSVSNFSFNDEEIFHGVIIGRADISKYLKNAVVGDLFY